MLATMDLNFKTVSIYIVIILVGFPTLIGAVHQRKTLATYTNASGTIYSPTYPGYLVNRNPRWIIMATSAQTVTLTFSVLDVETNSAGCVDSVKVLRRDSVGYFDIFETCQLENLTSPIVNVTGETHIWLSSGSAIAKGNGFYLTFNVSALDEPTTATPLPEYNIQCENNCGSLVKISNSLTLSAQCISNCLTGDHQHKWTLNAPSKQPVITVTENVASLNMEAFSLVPGGIHTLTLDVLSQGTTVATTSYTFTVTPLPEYNIQCENNCGSLVKISNSLALSAQCISNCLTGDHQHKWTLNAPSNQPVVTDTENVASLNMEAFSLVPGGIHTLTLDVLSQGTTVATTSYTFTVTPLPEYNIQCKNNCGSLVKISSSVTLGAQCISNCLAGDHQHKWTLNAPSNQPVITDTENVTTLSMAPFSLKPGGIHTLTLDVLSQGTNVATTNYTFTANTPPTGAVCSVSPQQGHALAKEFVISCDLSQVDANKQLSFEISAKTKAVYSVIKQVYSGVSPTSDKVSLPLGNAGDSYKTEVIVNITDSVGDSDGMVKEVVVLPSNESTSGLVKQLTILINFTLADIESVMADTDVLKNIYVSKISSTDKAAVTLAQLSLAQSLVKLSITSKEDLQKQLAALDVIIREDVNSKTQLLALDILDKILSSTGRLNITHCKEEMHNIFFGVLQQTSKFYEAANNIMSQDNANVTEVKQILQNIDIINNAVNEELLNCLKTGDLPLQMAGPTSETQLYKATSNNLDAAPLNYGNNTLTVTAASNSSSDMCLQTTTSFNSLNPYMWDNSSSLVHSAVTGFNIQQCPQTNNRNKRSAQNTGIANISAEFLLPEGSKPFVVDVVTYAGEMVVHHMNLSSPYKPIIVSVYPRETETLKVYVGFEEELNFTNSVTVFEVPDTSKATFEEKHSFIFNTNFSKKYQGSTLYIGVIDKNCSDSNNCTGTVNLAYSYKITEISCLHWDDILSKWTNTECQIEPGSTPTKVKFKSNLLGSLGAGVFVGPNTINFNTVFNDLGSKIVENIAVIATVFLVILLYIPLALICRRLDKMDKRKWMLLPLAENDKDDEHSYEIHVYTGDKRHAGTDSNVYIVVAGTEGDTGVRKLDDGERKNFGQEDVSLFLLNTSHTLGIPVTIKLWHDNTGVGSKKDWYVSKVVIVDKKAQKWYVFLCERWLSKDRSWGTTECVTHLASSEDMLSGSRLLNSNMSKMFSSDHIWFSVGKRKTRSVFTRLQRLSCCLATLMVTMAASAMWYGTGDAVQTQSLITIGILSITVHQVYTSVMSSLIIAPPILIIIFLYEKSKPKPAKKNPMDVLERVKTIKPKKSKKLPYWCVYIAHALVVLSVTAGAFFTILYAFEWGKEKSEEWLGCLFISVIQSILLIQPVKVIIVIILYSFLLKMDFDTCDLQEEIGKMETKTNDMIPLVGIEEGEIIPEHIKEELRKKQLLDKKMTSLFYEVLWGVVFICLLLWTLMGNQDSNVYLQNQNLKSIFTNEVPSIMTIDDIWSWFNNSLLPGIYTTNTGDKVISDLSIDDKFLNDFNSIQIGKPTIRQQRVKQTTCPFLKRFEKIIGQCSQELNAPWIDTANYEPSWDKHTNNSIQISQLTSIEEAFTHVLADELKTVPFWGRLQWYDGNGYVAKLQNSLQNSRQLLNELREKKWIDKYTRVVVMEFTTWNPSTNLFSFVTVCLELSITGGLMFKENIQSVQLYRYVGAAGLLNILMESLTLFMAMVVTIQEIIKIFRNRKSYFKVLWNLITMLCLVCFYVAVGMYIWRCVLTVRTLEHVMNIADYVSFSLISTTHIIFINALGISVFLLELRLLHSLRYIHMISVLGRTLFQAAGKLLSVGLQYVLLFMSFSVMFFLMYGSQMEEYQSFPITVKSVAMIAFDFRGFEKYITSIGVFGVVMLLIYAMVVMVITMNMFVTVLNDFISMVKDVPSDEHEVIDHIIKMFRNILPGTPKNKRTKHGLMPEKKYLKKDIQSNMTESVEKKACDLESIVEELETYPISSAVEDLLFDLYFWKNRGVNLNYSLTVNNPEDKLTPQDVICYSSVRSDKNHY